MKIRSTWTPIRLFVTVIGALAVAAARNGTLETAWTEWILFLCLILLGIDLIWRPQFALLDWAKTDRNENATTLDLKGTDDDQRT